MIVLSYSPYKNGIISNFWWFPILKWPQEFRSKLTISYFWYFWAFDHIPKFLFFRHFSHFPYFLWNWPIQKWWEALKIECGFIRNWSEFLIESESLEYREPPFCYWENIIISGYNLSRLSEGHFYHWNQFHPRQTP